MSASPLPMRPSGKVLAACGLWMILLGVYFVLLRPALLPEDPRFMGTSIEALRAAAPGLEGWLGHVFNVIGEPLDATKFDGVLHTLAVEATSGQFLDAAKARGCRFQIGSDMLFEQIPAYLEYFGFPSTTPEVLRSIATLKY